MTESLTRLLVGLLCAGGGGELFIRGIVSLAAWARIPAGIVGPTIAAFATSSPELSVGDAIGSNLVNLGAVLGIALLLSPTAAPRKGMKRDFPLLRVFLAWFIATVREALHTRRLRKKARPWRRPLRSAHSH